MKITPVTSLAICSGVLGMPILDSQIMPRKGPAGNPPKSKAVKKRRAANKRARKARKNTK